MIDASRFVRLQVCLHRVLKAIHMTEKPPQPGAALPRLRRFFWAFFLLAALAVCATGDSPKSGSDADPYYVAGTREQREELRDLFKLLARESRNGEEQFSVVREIAGEYARLKEYGRLINFLSDWTHGLPRIPILPITCL
jgi:hypothetical protein